MLLRLRRNLNIGTVQHRGLILKWKTGCFFVVCESTNTFLHLYQSCDRLLIPVVLEEGYFVTLKDPPGPSCISSLSHWLVSLGLRVYDPLCLFICEDCADESAVRRGRCLCWGLLLVCFHPVPCKGHCQGSRTKKGQHCQVQSAGKAVAAKHRNSALLRST